MLQEEAQRDHSPLGLQLVADAFGKDHPYARPIGGREIADVTRDEVCKFIDDHYAPDRAILVISGRFDVESVTQRVAARFGPIKRQAAGARVVIHDPLLSGGTARHLSRFRSVAPIYGLSRHPSARRRMALMRDVFPIAYDSQGQSPRQAARGAIALLYKLGQLSVGDRVVITSGDHMEHHGATNTLRLLQVGEGGAAEGLGEL